MKNFILFCLLLSFACCTISLLNASYEKSLQKNLKIVLDDKFRASMHIETIGVTNVKFDLQTRFTYFTSPDCQDCYLFTEENELTPYSCLPQNSCLVVGQFTNFQISQDYFASGDIIDVPIVIDGTILYLQGVYHVKYIKPTSLNPQKYDSQRIGLLLYSIPSARLESQVLLSLFNQGKIDKLGYSIYYTDNSYHLIIPGYDTQLVYQPFYNLTSVSHLYYNETIIKNFNGQLLFCRELLNTSQVVVQIDPTFDDSFFQFHKHRLDDFIQIINEKRLQPDMSIFTADQLGKWSYLVNDFTFDINILIDQSGDFPKKPFLELQYTSQQFMEQKNNYYMPKLKFLDINQDYLPLGKRVFSQYLFYTYQDENMNYKYALTPLKPKKQLRQVG
ncbi:hypothetical protein TTHERM_00582200 (macronuclear) [Tetrahymena thermophila SB210]|uniref:Transmembrane protein n=1 Tax=Tetrahymena thermophila (strain SB210) TaxID=312017 RepID=Q23Q70_TETTS|nr:hypothetical protein TTHERM_00582200 [Tetrahymena thermophila SB210]EAR98714.1 hypothetical protein TTHERM_00582200 [Tetrahymena thermophila SB210]|eukprot:XP_001018959.1 hypothetical protein TTHERM_00582200 [Tetrahymena thermophila SB210]